MGSSLSSIYNTVPRTDVYKSPNEDDQSVVYSTFDSRTCTLRTVVGVQTAMFTLRDFTLDNVGTRIEIRVRHLGGGDSAADIAYAGSTLEVNNGPEWFNIVYGVPRGRCAYLLVAKHYTDSHGYALYVKHLYTFPEENGSVLVFRIWYDFVKGRFMCTLTGPSQHSSTEEAMVAMEKAYLSSDAGDSTVGNGSNQTSITGHINNTRGVVHGHLNGSIVNFFNN